MCHRRNYPRAFGIKMVEAAEMHGAAPVATTIIDDDPVMELAAFDALDWSDMWDDACCSGFSEGMLSISMLVGLAFANGIWCVICCINCAGSG